MEEDIEILVGIVGPEKFSEVCRQIGGRMLYIPKGNAITAIERNEKIIAEFDGRNAMALARKHKLSVSRIRQIVASCRP